MILPLVLWCENWYVKLKEHKLRVSENRMLKRMFIPKGSGGMLEKAA